MEKQISAIRYKMIAVICIIGALGTWQWEFIYNGVMAHVYMNVTILGTFAFGVITAFIFVSKLKNEVIASYALKEMWEDIRRGPIESKRDPAWQYYRCAQPGKVFKRPRLLGHAYDLVTEELARTKNIRVSLETMNTLVHKIDETIADEKSLIVYISGLLVFMGLIGTFIGLLHMVGAIGGIIGSLANSGDGAAASGAFQKLLGALEEPLRGMAAGFASSLFGLFSSLVVGLMGRFAGQAANVLKGQFESWLASVVQLSDVEEIQDSQHGNTASVLEGPVADATMVKLVGALLTDYTRVAGSFDHAAKALQDMRSAQATQSDALARAIDRIVEAQAGQTQLLQAFSTSAPPGRSLSDVALKIERFADRIMDRAETDGARLRDTLQALEQSHAAELRLLTAHQREAAEQISTAIEHAAAANGPTTDAINTMSLRLDRFAERLTDRAESDGARLRDALQALALSHANEVRLLDAHQHNAAGQFASALHQLSADVERRTSLPAIANIEEALERSLRKGWNSGIDDTGRAIQQLVDTTDARLVDLLRMQDQHIRTMIETMRQNSTNSGTDQAMRSVEAAVTEGLARVGQSVETAFAAYASLTQVAIAALDRANAAQDLAAVRTTAETDAARNARSA